MNGENLKAFLILILAIAMTGCASITMDANQAIKVETFTKAGQEVSGADCSLTNNFSTANLKSGQSANMRRSDDEMSIKCSSAGQPEAHGQVISRINGGMVGNLLFGGPIGAYLDHSNGKGYNYPTWMRLIFGEARTYDRRESVDGGAQLGKLNSEVSASGSTNKPSDPAPQSPSTAVAVAPVSRVGVPTNRIDDPSTLPYVGTKAKLGYSEWLTKPLPRAFALSERGYWAGAWGDDPEDPSQSKDPGQRALSVCSKNAAAPCKLYAVDNAVVWPAQRN